MSDWKRFGDEPPETDRACWLWRFGYAEAVLVRLDRLGQRHVYWFGVDTIRHDSDARATDMWRYAKPPTYPDAPGGAIHSPSPPGEGVGG